MVSKYLSTIQIFVIEKSLKGFAAPVQTIAPLSPSKKQLSPDHPNPALPITEVRLNLMVP